MYKREIENDLKRDSTKGKIICLIGQRQVGKITLLGQIIEDVEKVLSLNCDERVDVAEIENKSSAELKSLFHG